jgi:hypothetical protein
MYKNCLRVFLLVPQLIGAMSVPMVYADQDEVQVSLHLTAKSISTADAAIVRIDVTNVSHATVVIPAPLIVGHNAIVEFALDDGEPMALLNRGQRKSAGDDVQLKPQSTYSTFGVVWTDRERFAVFADEGICRLRCRMRYKGEIIYSPWLDVPVRKRETEAWRFLRHERTLEFTDSVLERSLKALSRAIQNDPDLGGMRSEFQKHCKGTLIEEIVCRKLDAAELIGKLDSAHLPSWEELRIVALSDDDNVKEWLLRAIGLEALRLETELSREVALSLLKNSVAEINQDDCIKRTLRSNLAAMQRRAASK